MLNINELESRWRKYKIKYYVPYLVIFLSLCVIVVLMFTIYFNKEAVGIEPSILKEELIIKKEEPENKTVLVKEVKKENIASTKTIEKDNSKHSSSDSKKILLTPSLNFISNIKHTSVALYEEDINPPIVKETTLSVQDTKDTKDTKTIQKEKTIVDKNKEIKITQNSSISIKRNNTRDDIAHVIKRFKKNNNPALSLFIAKKYYELEEYNKSYNYALITNQINNNIEASWILFSKSLVKLNEKDEAIKTLKNYINHSHSNQAKILLEEIRSGKFK
ncbi:MAG: hypothetical protein U9N33_02030 [Campylobacterota bacterium]|nr:hypothetical protein [Campylobacterota bacterium]